MGDVSIPPIFGEASAGNRARIGITRGKENDAEFSAVTGGGDSRAAAVRALLDWAYVPGGA
jgi:hypothetical protein